MSGSHPTASGSPTFFFTTGYPINCYEYFVRKVFPLQTSRSEHLSSGIMKLHVTIVMSKRPRYRSERRHESKAKFTTTTNFVVSDLRKRRISLLFSQMERLIGFRELSNCYV